MDVRGRSVLVTGAASGIGFACAAMLTDGGVSDITLVDCDREGLEDVLLTLRSRSDAEIRTRLVDLADPGQLARLFDEADREFPPDVVLNNAGIVTGTPLFPEAEEARILQVIAVNTSAVILGTRRAVLGMARRGGGVVINTSSSAAVRTQQVADIVYAASKAAVSTFTRHCRGFAEAYGVRVNAVLPGIVDTPILLKSNNGQMSPWVQEVRARSKIMAPAEVAEAVLDLIRDDQAAGLNVLLTDGNREYV